MRSEVFTFLLAALALIILSAVFLFLRDYYSEVEQEVPYLLKYCVLRLV